MEAAATKGEDVSSRLAYADADVHLMIISTIDDPSPNRSVRSFYSGESRVSAASFPFFSPSPPPHPSSFCRSSATYSRTLDISSRAMNGPSLSLRSRERLHLIDPSIDRSRLNAHLSLSHLSIQPLLTAADTTRRIREWRDRRLWRLLKVARKTN